ncbi:MAG TPA: DUF3419 family protein [Thermosynechococcaceae cyanobacterium]
MSTQPSHPADFSQIRYAQCWEDADVLLAALEVQPSHTCLSIASAGDNTLALLSRGPRRLIAIDFSPAQIACLELRVAAYRNLSHPELLVLLGSRDLLNKSPSAHLRGWLYQHCRMDLSPTVRQFWDDRPRTIAQGIGSGGKFERYLALFRRFVLPLIHSPAVIEKLFQTRSFDQREQFYAQQWDNWRWRSLFHLFFSRSVMGRLGRDPSFFRYVQGSVAEVLLTRTRDVLIRLDPAENPYLQWIATGQHPIALPFALRPENFEPIRANLDRLEWHCISLEDFLEIAEASSIDRFNLSNVFEWMSLDRYHRALAQLLRVGCKTGRLVYWNLLADRQCPEFLQAELRSLPQAQTLYQRNQTFFYKALIVEEIC